MFLTDYNAVFGDPVDENLSPLNDYEDQEQQQADLIRSARHQTFSDLPTPMLNQSHQPPVPGFHTLPISGGYHHGLQQPTLTNGRNPLTSGPFEPTYRSATPPSSVFTHTQANSSTTSVGTSQSLARTNNSDQQPLNPNLNVPVQAPSPSPGPSVGGGDRASPGPSPPSAQSKKNRRESSMLGAGLMQGRKQSRQTLANTNSSHIPDNAWLGYQLEQRRLQAEAEAQQAALSAGGNNGEGDEGIAKGLW